MKLNGEWIVKCKMRPWNREKKRNSATKCKMQNEQTWNTKNEIQNMITQVDETVNSKNAKDIEPMKCQKKISFFSFFKMKNHTKQKKIIQRVKIKLNAIPWPRRQKLIEMPVLLWINKPSNSIL